VEQEVEMELRIAMALGVMAASPVAAQDVLGPVNPVDYMPAITMGAALNAQTESIARGSSRSAHASDASARRTCREIPRYQRAYGPSDRRIVQLKSLCRRAGYR
jgi:hypothetical protein